ncbi:MAG: outer membrane beta-barrel protein [Bacteroidales bacterium]|nr:outer membrane beta-barrel protein [Bacteroidales bacterium]
MKTDKHRYVIFLMAAAMLAVVVMQAQAQPAETKQAPSDITGMVTEQVEENGATRTVPVVLNICLLHPKDSAVLRYTTSNDKGRFSLHSVPAGNYLLSFSGLGYATRYKRLLPADFSGKPIDLGMVTMEESSIALGEVTITVVVPEVVVKEDTLEYNPAAFKMQEGAVVEDLIRRLPGVEVEADGKITTATGKEVRRVFVDGKEFFGNDPKMATKNLTVDVIDRVQVIEKKSDVALLTGVDDGEEETVINITIKKGMKRGWMGNASAGAGSLAEKPSIESPRYTANAMINRFLENDRISLIVNTNNINNQGSTDQGNTVRTGMRGSSGGGNGINKSTTLGINAQKAFTDDLKAGANLSYNYADNHVWRSSFRTNLLKDSVSYRDSESADQDYSHNLHFNTRIEYKSDSMNNFNINLNLSYNSSESNDWSNQTTIAGDSSTRVNASNANTHTNSYGWVWGAEATWAHRFAKKGRRFNLTLNAGQNNSSGDGRNISSNTFFLQPSRDKSVHQDINTTTDNASYQIRVSYVEPLGENNTLQFSYNARWNRTQNLKSTYDEVLMIYDPTYNKSLSNHYINQTAGLSFRSVKTHYDYTVGINVVPSYTQSTSFIRNGDHNGKDSTVNRLDGRKVYNYSPQIDARYRFSSAANLRFTYRGSTRQPSVSQLDPTVNNTNPLNIRMGNPDLLPAFTNNLSLRFSKNNRLTQRSIMAAGSFNFTMNEIISFTEYEEQTGIQTTSPRNENGSWSSSGDVLYNIPFGKAKRLKFNVQSRLNYNHQLGYTKIKNQSEKNISMTTGINQNLGMSYSKDWFYGQLRTGFRYQSTDYSHEGKTSQTNYNYSLTYNTQLYLPASVTLASDVNYRVNRGLSSGYNKEEVLWNVSLSKQILRKKNVTFRVQWNDILQQRLNINHNITANYIEDSRYNTLTSYFILSLSYRFNSMGRSGRSNREYRDNSREDYNREDRREDYNREDRRDNRQWTPTPP